LYIRHYPYISPHFIRGRAGPASIAGVGTSVALMYDSHYFQDFLFDKYFKKENPDRIRNTNYRQGIKNSGGKNCFCRRESQKIL
jgi:hypothetical protein